MLAKCRPFLLLIESLKFSTRVMEQILQTELKYVQVHAGISEDEKMKICYALNYEKLSDESLKLLARNSNFPPEVAARALITLKSDFKNVICLKTISSSFIPETVKGDSAKEDDSEEFVVYAKGLDLSSEKDKLILHLQGTRWRTAQLEPASRVMPLPDQVTDVVKTKLYLPKYIRSFSKLCS